MGSKGISPDSTLVFYGDNFNWWATYALWVVSLFGHRDVRVLDGGRMKWEEEGRPSHHRSPTQRAAADYPTVDRDDTRKSAPSFPWCSTTPRQETPWWTSVLPRSSAGNVSTCPVTRTREQPGAGTYRQRQQRALEAGRQR